MGKPIVQQRFPKRAIDEDLGPAPIPLLDAVSKVLGSVYSTELDVPYREFEGNPEKKVKEFCVGLLENPVNHAWWEKIRDLGHRERTSIQGSLFLARKVLEQPPDPLQGRKHAALMATPAPPSSIQYLEHIDRSVDEMFEIGWDRGYRGHVFRHTPTSSSCLEANRSSGGVRAYTSRFGPESFQDLCLSESVHPAEYRVNYSVVRTAGKNRGVTVPSGHASFLLPLHRTMYDYITSTSDVFVRGEARAKKFKSFHRKKGEIFVSGDYESATDNLSTEVTERMLLRILSRARFIPLSIQSYAMRSLRATICYVDESGRRTTVRQARGQLMGNPLSFPLLCLHNYFAFKFAIPRDVPVRINGDDIVFRCRPNEYKRWAEMVSSAGLVLSKGKTLVNRSIFSLNSAFFDSQSRRVREIPVIRSTMLLPSEGPPSAADFQRFTRNWKDSTKCNLGLARVGGLWLRCHRATIGALGRSMHGLGVRCNPAQLHCAGLADREAFFSGSKHAITEHPVPISPHDFLDPQEAKDWSYVRTTTIANDAEVRRWELDHVEYCRRRVWEPVLRTRGEQVRQRWKDWWEEVRRTGQEPAWRAWKDTAKRARKMCKGLGISLRMRAVNRPVAGIWIPSDIVPLYRCLRRGGVGAY